MSQTPQGPLQPWLHELVVAVDGHGTALGRAHGQMTGAGAEGFYVDDARVLSVLALELGGEEPAFVGGSARGGSADFLGSARGLGDDGPDPSVEVARPPGGARRPRPARRAVRRPGASPAAP